MPQRMNLYIYGFEFVPVYIKSKLLEVQFLDFKTNTYIVFLVIVNFPS